MRWLPGVRDVDPPRGVRREAHGLDELARAVSGAAPGARDLALGVEADDPLVSRVGDEERAAARARPRAARRTRGPDRVHCSAPLAVGPEARHAVVPGVGDVDLAVRPDGDAARLVELAVAVAPRADRTQERAVAVEDRDPAVLRVRDVEVALGVRGDSARLGELAGPRARSAELASRRELHGLGGVVARGRVLDLDRERLEHAAAAEVLADVDGRVLRSDRAPDLVEEPEAERGPRSSGASSRSRSCDLREPPGADRNALRRRTCR